MRALIQRVTAASVSLQGTIHSGIGKGMLIFLGVTHADTDADARYLAERCASLRMFEDVTGKMNCSVQDVGGKALVVSQFTLYGDTRRGNRPSFTDAASAERAEELYNAFVMYLRNEIGTGNVETGVFRAMMGVSLVNDGPVTLLLESKSSSNQ